MEFLPSKPWRFRDFVSALRLCFGDFSLPFSHSYAFNSHSFSNYCQEREAKQEDYTRREQRVTGVLLWRFCEARSSL